MVSFCGICYGPTPNAYYETQWLSIITALGVDAAWQRTQGLTAAAERAGVRSCTTAADLPTDVALVVLSPKTARVMHPVSSLFEFSHPERAIYLFGSDTTWLSQDELGNREPDHVVYVPVASRLESDELYSFVIGAVVLVDRRRRHGR